MFTQIELDSAAEGESMTLKEFAQHFGASNWRKAFNVAIEKHVENGAEILAEQVAAFEACRRSPTRENKSRCIRANAAKAEAKQQIIDMFQLHIDA